MRRRSGLGFLLVGAALFLGAAQGQTRARVSPRSGRLTVWVVIGQGPAAVAAASNGVDPKQYKTESAGSFQGDVGSRAAGDAGRTMGDFGVSTTDLPKAAAAANKGPVAAPVTKLRPDPLYVRDRSAGIDVEDVGFDDLKALLESAVQSGKVPDLLLSEHPLEIRGFRPVPVPTATWVPLSVEADESTRARRPAFAYVSVATQNSATVRSYLASFTELPNIQPESTQGRTEVEIIAAQVYTRYLQGERVDLEADEELAGYERRPFGRDEPSGDQSIGANQTTQRERFTRARLAGPDLRVDTVVVSQMARLAVVGLRAVSVKDEQAQGVRYGLMVLRRDARERWRVLQVSPDLAPELLKPASEMLVRASFAESRALRNEGSSPLGISQASPLNGDQRGPQPELWWDNLGGATLQVVEWQVGGDWRMDVPSYLFFVPDSSGRLQTRAVARFATSSEPYRWRVWSVGSDGTVVLSGWRGLTIVER